MVADKPKLTYRKDYKPTPFLVEKLELTFLLNEEFTTVRSKLHFVPNPASPSNGAPELSLDGEREHSRVLRLCVRSCDHQHCDHQHISMCSRLHLLLNVASSRSGWNRFDVQVQCDAHCKGTALKSVKLGSKQLSQEWHVHIKAGRCAASYYIISYYIISFSKLVLER